MRLRGIRNIAIVGVGQIGGSIGLALRAGGFDGTVTGIDVRPAALSRARRMGAISVGEKDLFGGVRGADLVVLAAPVGEILRVIPVVARGMKPEAVLTDVGSVKAPILEAYARSGHARFAGGHPMAGNERPGLDGADAALFRGRVWVVSGGDPGAARSVKDLARFLGAVPVSMDPDVHDGLVSLTSHMPYCAAAAVTLAAVADPPQEDLFTLVASGFLDTTRVAASDPVMMTEALLGNRRAVARALARLEVALSRISALVEAGDAGALRVVLEEARRARRLVGEKRRG